MPLLKTSLLTKKYATNRGAINIDLEINQGETVGFIGPNGAGKSTTLNLIQGFLIPDYGNIELFDKETTWKTIYKHYHKIGILPSETSYGPNQTPQQIFIDTSALFGRNLTAKWTELAEYLELNITTPFKKLSLGNKKKVGVICAIMHDPKLLLLDEPTSGLDPLMQQKVMKLFSETTKKGGAVLLSSHDLSEVQLYCDRIIMIKDGHILLKDTTANILEKALKLFRIKNLPDKVLKDIKKHRVIKKIETSGEETLLYTSNQQAVLYELYNHSIYNFYLERPSLEQTFMDLYQ